MRSHPTQTAYIVISMLVVTAMGFLFKFYTGFAQEWFNNYVAAIFYEIFWYLLAFLFWQSRKAIAQIPLWVFLITCGIEFLQLWHQRVKVKPNSKQRAIKEEADGSLTVYLKSPPVDGKANEELIKL